MTPERYQLVGRLYRASLELEPERRAAYLAEACAGDEDLRREVESLLNYQAGAASFIEQPAFEVAAQMLGEEPAGKLVGGRVDHYQMLSLLGAGGMGEVYLARDTRLGRPVALKVLPEEFTQDAERLQRFVREAQAASALNHPNIITIYEVGAESDTHFIATEFIEGQTLRQRLAGGRLELGEALEVATQVAAALDVAHRAGITHRDIKPENLMLRPDSLVKVLDFGLAKLTEQPQVEVDPDTPTVDKMTTGPGTVMGTAHYMSPEQARGQKVDARTDLFSLGVVLYEMVAARPPFEGVNAVDVMGAILRAEPAPLRDQAPGAPPGLESILTKALKKDREERYHTAKDLLTDLKRLKQQLEFQTGRENSGQPTSGGSTQVVTGNNQPGRVSVPFDASRPVGTVKRPAVVAISAVVALVVLAGIALTWYKLIGQNQARTPAAPGRVRPFTSFPGSEDQPAVSPDGKQIAFVWGGEKGDNQDIYTKLVDIGTPLRLTTDPAPEFNPVWSPDGRYLAFLRQSSDSSGIYLIPSLGGPERKLAETAPKPNLFIEHCLDFSPDGKLLAVADKDSQPEPFSIFSIGIETGGKRRLTSPPAGSLGDHTPAFSPDGQTLAFVRAASAGVFDLYLMPASGGEPKRLTFDNVLIAGLAWTPDGRDIVFSSWREGGIYNLWRVPAAGGRPERITWTGLRVTSPAISRQGDYLAYTQSMDDTNIWRYEAAGARGRNHPPTNLISSTQLEVCPGYSPDGKSIVFASGRSGSWEVWVSDSDGGHPAQLTTSGGASPCWSPDGRQIAFDARPGNNYDIYVISAEGGRPRRLTSEPTEEVAPSWSRDGRWVYFSSNRSGSLELWKVPAAGGEAVQVTRHGGFDGCESPDGQFLYYAKRNAPGLWRIPVAGGEETLVLDHHQAGYWRYWAVVEQGIYFATAETPSHPVIEFFSFATGQVTHIATLEKPIVQWYRGLAVSPDGRSILCVQQDQSGKDIMLMEGFR